MSKFAFIKTFLLTIHIEKCEQKKSLPNKGVTWSRFEIWACNNICKTYENEVKIWNSTTYNIIFTHMPHDFVLGLQTL